MRTSGCVRCLLADIYAVAVVLLAGIPAARIWQRALLLHRHLTCRVLFCGIRQVEIRFD